MIENKINPSPRNKPLFYYGYNIVVLAFIIMVLTYGVRTSFGVFFKPIEVEFNWSRALISGAVTLSMIVQGIWGIYMGRINDRVGSRWVITICSFFIGLGLLLVSLTQYSWQLYIFYGIIVGDWDGRGFCRHLIHDNQMVREKTGIDDRHRCGRYRGRYDHIRAHI